MGDLEKILFERISAVLDADLLVPKYNGFILSSHGHAPMSGF